MPQGSPRRKAVIWIAGVALAVFSGLSALASVGAARAPLLAAELVPENGMARAKAADFLVKREILANDGALPDAIPPRAVDHAKRAFTAEPLAVQALRIIALDRDIGGRRDDARKIMRLLPDLSKREAPTNLWLSQDYGRLGRDEDAFTYFDMTLRVSDNSAPIIIPPLVQGLKEPRLIAPLAELLSVDPPWARAFWIEAARRPAVAAEAASLRMELGRDYAVEDEIDRQILTNMVAQRQIEQALRYYQHLTGRRPAQNLSFEFSSLPEFPPFDWDLASDGEFSSLINPSAKRMFISVAPESSGVVARRFVTLAPGQYAIAARYDATNPRDVQLAIGLRCLEKAKPLVRTDPVRPKDSRAQTVEAGSDCAHYMLEIDYRNESKIDGADIAIDSVVLRKLD